MSTPGESVDTSIMSTLRNYCPSCEVVTVEPAALVIEIGDSDEVADMSFVCPECGDRITQWVNRWAVPVLQKAGCTVIAAMETAQRAATGIEDLGLPQTGPITTTEIERFVEALDHPAWDELIEA